MIENPNHGWPTDPARHVWTAWMTKTGMPKPTQYRSCIHPHCGATETREAPRA